MAITTKEKAKAVLQISSTDKDDYIDAMIPLVEEWLEGYQGYAYDEEEEGSPVYPPGHELVAIRMIGYNLNQAGVQSESLGDHSISIATDYPKEILRGIRRRVKFT